jgi:spermidine synthase
MGSVLNDFFPADPNTVRPLVYEDERTVSLHFDMSAIQSRMRRGDPVVLELDYTRTMMGFVLIEPQPQRILMIGLGGGSLAKYCHRHLPRADITAVEINPHVIAMRDAFFVPADGARFRVVCDDGAAFVERTRQRYDVVMVDGFDYEGQPKGLATAGFYSACRSVLARSGLLVVNLHDEEPACSLLIDRIAAAFDGDVQVMAAESGGNRVVFAGRCADFGACIAEFDARWAGLPAAHERTLRVSASRLVHSARWRDMNARSISARSG